jgi:hypothetical protein
LQKIIEQRDVLCFHDEFSGIVSNLKTAISFSGRQGPACRYTFLYRRNTVEQTEATQTQAVTNAEPEFAALVGIDWADKKHYWSLSTPSGRTERGTLDNTPEAVEVWMAELRLRFQGRPVAVALEQRKGALMRA